MRFEDKSKSAVGKLEQSGKPSLKSSAVGSVTLAVEAVLTLNNTRVGHKKLLTKKKAAKLLKELLEDDKEK